jgi:hypothetical protein
MACRPLVPTFIQRTTPFLLTNLPDKHNLEQRKATPPKTKTFINQESAAQVNPKLAEIDRRLPNNTHQFSFGSSDMNCNWQPPHTYNLGTNASIPFVQPNAHVHAVTSSDRC